MSGASTKSTHPKTCQEEWRVNWARLKHKTYQSESTVPESGGDFTRRFAFELRRDFDFLLRLPRGSSPLSSLRRSLHQIPHKLPKKGEFSKNNPHKRPHFFRPHFVYNSAISVVHIHWSRLTRDHFRFLHYLPYLHFDDIVSTARTRSRHKKGTRPDFFLRLCLRSHVAYAYANAYVCVVRVNQPITPLPKFKKYILPTF